ncbi:hypothetical protein [Pseudomonas sp. H3_D04]
MLKTKEKQDQGNCQAAIAWLFHGLFLPLPFPRFLVFGLLGAEGNKPRITHSKAAKILSVTPVVTTAIV